MKEQKYYFSTKGVPEATEIAEGNDVQRMQRSESFAKVYSALLRHLDEYAALMKNSMYDRDKSYLILTAYCNVEGEEHPQSTYSAQVRSLADLDDFVSTGLYSRKETVKFITHFVRKDYLEFADYLFVAH